MGIVRTSPENITKNRGENVTFSCQTDAGPSSQYLWLYRPSDIVCTRSNCTDGIFTFNVTDQGMLNAKNNDDYSNFRLPFFFTYSLILYRSSKH